MKSGDLKKLALCAMLTAVAVAINFLSSLFPALSLTIAAVSGFVTGAALLEYGYKDALLVYLAVVLLSVFIVPNKESVVYFGLLFGHYPMTKLALERTGARALAWTLKLICANILLVAVYFIVSHLIGVYDDMGTIELAAGALIYNAAFVIYDICMTKIMLVYSARRSRKR